MLGEMIRRNIRLYFRDKATFLTSLITPVILLVLYVSFLGNVFRDAFQAVFAPFGGLPEDLLSGCVGAQLISSILAVSCVTVTFCSNFLMVQDKVSGAVRDFAVTPAPNGRFALAYYLSNLASSLLICFTATAICLLYVALTGWYFNLWDVLRLLGDVFLMVLFGNAISSLINSRLSSQGHISAVGTIVSSGYGFICGAYMPISQFSPALQKVLSALPGTHGTALLRSDAMGGVFREMERLGFPAEALDELRMSMDCRVQIAGSTVPVWAMYAYLCGTTLLMVLFHVWLTRRKRV